MSQLVRKVAIVESRQLYAETFVPRLAEFFDDATFAAYATTSEVALDPDAITLIVLIAPALDRESLAVIVASAKTNPAIADLPFAVIADCSDPSVIMKALELEARGFIPTSLPLDQVGNALRLILAGGIFVPAQSFRALSGSQPPQANAQAQQSGLSPAQLRIAKALRRGTPNKLIAYNLNMAESTVKVHVRTIMKKLKARNRTEIAFLTNQMFEEVE